VNAMSSFVHVRDLPKPLWGGHVNGGSTLEGGLGSIDPESLVVSSCGRRVAWTDTDGRIAVVTLPSSSSKEEEETATPGNITILPKENENKEPLIGIEAALSWSPGARYLAIQHTAKNQFSIISIADLDHPSSSSLPGSIEVKRIVQATPSRFNSADATWGYTGLDLKIHNFQKKVVVSSSTTYSSHPMLEYGGATTLYYTSDRDVVLSNDIKSPWGTRAPTPHFDKQKHVYALPLQTRETQVRNNAFMGLYPGLYSGGAVAELMVDTAAKIDDILSTLETEEKNVESGDEGSRRMQWWDDDDDVEGIAVEGRTNITEEVHTTSPPPTSTSSSSVLNYTLDAEIDFGPHQDTSLSFARRAYRLSHIPAANYIQLLCQVSNDPSLILVKKGDDGKSNLVVFASKAYPGDGYDKKDIEAPGSDLKAVGINTKNDYIYVVYGDKMKVIPNTADGVSSILISDAKDYKKNIVDTTNIGLSVWPSLEYQQMYADAWRMMRDYFYDPNMTSIPWKDVYHRYVPLVKRCGKREELDDVLKLMASEVSALHVFVYGGEYASPLHGSVALDTLSEVGSLGAMLRWSSEWNGYEVVSVFEHDLDFGLVDGVAMYSPLSEQTVRKSGQHGLEAGDVIIGVNGESVATVPDIHMLLRGTAGRSVRLEVLRVSSGSSSLRHSRAVVESNDTVDVDAEMKSSEETDIKVQSEPLIVVPITGQEADKLRYASWEWKTRQAAKSLAAKADFTVGYIHLQSMSGAKSIDSFVRGFYPDYDKQALIIDVRHNTGGNIDSWLLDVLQRRAWMYWQGRATNITTGGIGWDEQFAFRGHIVVLMNEHTSSDGEGFSRGMSELGLGKLVGTRTWGGGIWLSSDNKLVDGGIATAPEIGQYNDNFGWGMGIEMMGVTPDVVVDNDPREAYDGKDEQLEKAIEILKDWLKEEPVVLPREPGPYRDNSMTDKLNCPAKK